MSLGPGNFEDVEPGVFLPEPACHGKVRAKAVDDHPGKAGFFNKGFHDFAVKSGQKSVDIVPRFGVHPVVFGRTQNPDPGDKIAFNPGCEDSNPSVAHGL